jgi:hypothetical protein
VTAGVTAGLGLGGIGQTGPGSGGGAVLVPVQGNAYATVALLDFGSGDDDDQPDDGSRRMPWLSARYPLGDTSPLTRFVIGLEEAIREYRGAGPAPLKDGDLVPGNDPWREDLFFRRPPLRPPVEQDEEPEARLPGADEFWEQFGDDRRPHTAAARGAVFEALAVLLAGAAAAVAPVPADRRRAVFIEPGSRRGKPASGSGPADS